jgi:hypothetical protein
MQKKEFDNDYPDSICSNDNNYDSEKDNFQTHESYLFNDTEIEK